MEKAWLSPSLVRLRPLPHAEYHCASQRGKVLRIVLALLSATTEPEYYSQQVWDWWNVVSPKIYALRIRHWIDVSHAGKYSRVQFIQIIPAPSVSVRPSRVQSPVGL
jgi:hypothetical protein